jgi:hypothetical protein
MTVSATDRYDAEDVVKDKIIFHAVKLVEGQEKPETIDENMCSDNFESLNKEMNSENLEFLKGMFGIK